MKELDPRIKTALVSVHPTSTNPAWHGAPTALGVLRGVNAAVAVWRSYPGANNIREIALHVAFCENGVANHLSGQKVSLKFKQRKPGWALMLEEVAKAQWKDELTLVKLANTRLVDALTAFDPEHFYQPLVKGSTRPAAEYVHGVAEHSLFHAAQMEAIKTLAKHQGIG